MVVGVSGSSIEKGFVWGVTRRFSTEVISEVLDDVGFRVCLTGLLDVLGL